MAVSSASSVLFTSLLLEYQIQEIMQCATDAIKKGDGDVLASIITPLTSLQPHHQKDIFNHMLKEWTANGCSLNVGKKMMTTHLFKRLDIKEILFVGGKSTLELSFRERNFQTLGLLMGHPQSSQIDADYFAQAINSAWFHTDNSQNYLSDLVKALMDFLPNDLLKNIRNHKNLWDPAKSVIDNNQIKHCWRLFLTALSVSA